MAENTLSNYLANPGDDRSSLVTALGELGLLRSDASQDFSDEDQSVIRSNIGAASLEQGSLAETALQPGDVGTEPGTFAAGDDARINGAMQKAQNLSDLANKGAARSNLSTPVHVADRTALKAINPAQDLVAVSRENPRQIPFYPHLLASLSATSLAAMATDVGENIYVASTENPAFVWIRQGAEARGFWTNSTTPAYVHRLRDRVMIGDSAGFDCSTTPDTNTGASWLHTIKPGASRSMGYLESHGRVVSTGGNGMQFVGATRIAGTTGVEGYGGIFHVRNETTVNTKAWGLYIDAVRKFTSSGHVAGIELDVANCTGVADVSVLPYGLVGGESANGWTYGLALASGADPLVNPDALPASFALSIVNNGARFNTGIVFRSDALVTDGGGYGRAITLAQQHKVGWYGSSDGLEAAYLTSTVTQAANGTRSRFVNGGFELIRYADDKPYAKFLFNASAVNYLEMVATAAGLSPIIRVAGDDADRNLVLQPKGTGVLQVTYAATTAADIASNRRVRIRVAGADIDLLGVLV